MKEKRICKRYTQPFKEEAVALITEQGYSVQQASDSLGIRSNMLYRWKHPSKVSLSEDERAELNRLRKEIKHLRMEKEILKKASGIEAQEMK